MADLIEQIEDVRGGNNVLWMGILRIALEADPERTKAVLREIGRHDSEIMRLLKELAE